MALVAKSPPSNAGDLRDRNSILGLEDPLEKEVATIAVFLPEESRGQRSLLGYHLRDCNTLDTTEQL